MDRREPLIFIVAGETSGDNLAGRLMAALTRKTGGPRPLCRRRRSAKRGAGPQEPLSHERSFGHGSGRGVAAFAAPRPAHQSNGSGSAAARARRRRHGRLRELLHAACASAPRLGHSHRALRRAATLGVASRPRQEAWAARQPHHGFAAVRGVFFRQIRHSLDLCRPPGHRDGCRSRRRPGLQGAAWAAGGCDRPLRASRLEERRGPPPHSRLWRGSAQPSRRPTRTSASSSRWPMPRPKPCAQ